MSQTIMNTTILTRLMRGDLTASALNRKIEDRAKYEIDQALAQMEENGLVEKQTIEREYEENGKKWDSIRHPFKLTEKGKFALQSVYTFHIMIEIASKGAFNFNNFKDTPKENSPEYIR